MTSIWSTLLGSTLEILSLHYTAGNMRKYEFWLTAIPSYKDRIYDSVFVRVNKRHWKPLFSHILCSVTYQYHKLNKLPNSQYLKSVSIDFLSGNKSVFHYLCMCILDQIFNNLEKSFLIWFMIYYRFIIRRKSGRGDTSPALFEKWIKKECPDCANL